ncbi:MAG: response regulator, partial [Starkeya sp.]|nr:response regulator [Starkeya sp.]
LEPSSTQAPRPTASRVLVTAPAGTARTALRALMRSLGHEVSLAEDPRAARLMGDRFDVILFDLDAYGEAYEAGLAAGPGRRIGLSTAAIAAPPGFEAVVPAGDAVALVLALLQSAPGR